MAKKITTVAISGGFDPIHIGHVRLILAAKKLGDRLIVILNNDNWLRSKKDYVFMGEEDRKEILLSIRGVEHVIITSHGINDPDRSVCRELKKIRPDIFANGGDRNREDAENKKSSLNPETILCQELGIKVIFNVGKGGKIRSSSELLTNFKNGFQNGIMKQ